MKHVPGKIATSVQIRPISAADFDAILKINAESSPAVAKLDETELREQVTLASIAWVATRSDQIVGYLVAFSSSDAYEGEAFQAFRAKLDVPFLYIDQVAICTEARRTSIASKMYEYLIQRCRELGMLTLCCDVNLRPANPVSTRFHNKFGFKAIGELETGYGCLVSLLSTTIPGAPSAFDAINRTNEEDLPRLFEVWESSVRATHSFLTEADLQSLIPLARAELTNFNPIYCLRGADGKLFAFTGVAASSIEMLFVHAEHRGVGAGRLLTEFAIQMLGANLVDVNEQNEPAIGFYRHLGFHQVGRSPLDSSGNPFPILHLALPAKAHHLRIARPVSDLARTRAMYCRGLGLRVVGSFDNHEGFDGVMLGVADASYHFEFTYCRSHPVVPSPTHEDLAVFYLPNAVQWSSACADMEAAGFRQVTSLNPYWDARGRTYEDHDGYRVVLQNDEWTNVETL